MKKNTIGPNLFRIPALLAPLLLVLLLPACRNQESVPPAKEGVLDLARGTGAAALTQDRLIPLAGEWEFHWQKLLPPEQASATPAEDYIQSPGYWNSRREDRPGYPAYGFSTWVLTVRLPDDAPPGQTYGLKVPRMVTAYRLWVNGRPAASNGRVAASREQGAPQYRNETYYFTPRGSSIQVVCQISNYHYRNGGMWLPVSLGTQKAVSRNRNTSIAVDLFLCGSLLIMALYHMVLYLYRRNDKTALFFGLFCFTIVARILATGETAATYFFPDFSWELLVRMELLPHAVGGLLFLYYFNNLHGRSIHPRLLQFFSATGVVFGGALLFLPARLSNHLVVPMELNLVFGILVIVTAAVRTAFLRREGWLILSGGLGIFFLTTLNDILFARQIISTAYLVPAGLFILIFSQAVLLAKMFSNSFKRTEYLSHEMRNLNQSMKRFVPDEFLRFLGKRSIKDIHLGNQTLQEMTILFSDIEAFTTISEMMNPQENFNFLNSYLKRMVPPIRKRQGFVDKYIGDAIMALFPRDPSTAVRAALDMHRILRTYNGDRARSGYPPIRFGTGIHTGSMMLGIIGENRRLESTVISDSVNLASRIERLTRTYGLDILISEATLNSMENPDQFRHRMVDVSSVKGKARRIRVYEIYDHQDEETVRLKDQTKPLMEKAIQAYLAGRLEETRDGARQVLLHHPQDLVAQLYLSRARDALEAAPPEV